MLREKRQYTTQEATATRICNIKKTKQTNDKIKKIIKLGLCLFGCVLGVVISEDVTFFKIVFCVLFSAILYDLTGLADKD